MQGPTTRLSTAPARRRPPGSGLAPLAVLLWLTACGSSEPQTNSAGRGPRERAVIDAELATATGAARIPLLIEMVRALRLREPDHAGAYAEEAVRLLDLHPDDTARLRVAVAMASAESLRSDLDAADRWVGEAARIVDRVSDPKLRWSYWRCVGEVRGLAGRLDEAIAALAQAATLAQSIGDANRRVATQIALSRSHLESGRHLDALEILLETLPTTDTSPDELNTSVRADLHNEIGSAYHHVQCHALAIEHYRKALTLWEGQQRLEIVGRLNIAAAMLRMGDFSAAIDMSRAALAAAEEVGDELGVAQLSYNIAYALVELDRAIEAVPYSERAHAIMQKIGNPQLVALSQQGLGRALCRAGDPERGEALLLTSVDDAARLEQRHVLYAAHESLAELYDRDGDPRTLHHLRELRRLDQEDESTSNQPLLDLHTRFEAVKREQQTAALNDDLRRQRTVAIGIAGLAALLAATAALAIAAWRSKRRSHAELERVHRDLVAQTELALARQQEIKVLQGMLPICCYCKKIRDDRGAWLQLERYIGEHSEATFSHGYCPECERQVLEDAGLT